MSSSLVSPLSETEILEIKTVITRLFQLYGDKDYIGEYVSQLEHALQCAYLAEVNGEEPEMILAALLHDIGHLVVYEMEDSSMVPDYLGARHHEKLGADYLRKLGMGESIPELVESHVLSKRWLSTDPSYHEKLSKASKQTLIRQGGPMTEQECDKYLEHPRHIQFTSLRLYDDGAKVIGKKTRNLEYYLSYLDRLS